MRVTLESVIKLLHDEDYALVIEHQEQVYPFEGRGIRPLYEVYRHQKALLNQSLVADKVSGKAHAMLCVAGGVKAVYADLMSADAIEIYQSNGIHYEYGQSVPHILNRDRSDLCPIEQLAGDLTPDCVESLCIRIESFFEKIAQNQKGK